MRRIALGIMLLVSCTKADRHAAAPPVTAAPLPPITHPAPTPAPDPADWFALPEGKLVTTAAERALYETPGQAHFYLRIRVTNRTDRVVGIDLRHYFEVLYANQWGWSNDQQRGVIDEMRAILKPPTPAEADALTADQRAGRLTAIAPHGHVDFYRDFNASGRADVEKQQGTLKFLLLAMDGQIRASDGANAEAVQVGEAEAGRILALPAPITWRTIPAQAIVLTDR